MDNIISCDASKASTTTSDASRASTLTHTGAELQSVGIITVIRGVPTYYQNVLNFIVTDPERLKLFYSALFEIRKVLGSSHPYMPFSSDGLVNEDPPEYYNLRSSGYLVLATLSYPASECSDNFTELLELICTPFGCVRPFKGGWCSDMRRTTHKFMSTMESRWTIEDCTDRIKYFPVYDDVLGKFMYNSPDIVNTPQNQFFGYHTDKSKYIRKFYIVKNVDNIKLPADGEIIVAGGIYGKNLNLARQVFESCASQKSHV